MSGEEEPKERRAFVRRVEEDEKYEAIYSLVGKAVTVAILPGKMILGDDAQSTPRVSISGTLGVHPDSDMFILVAEQYHDPNDGEESEISSSSSLCTFKASMVAMVVCDREGVIIQVRYG